MSIKFSIITITYNSEKTLRDTFESILEQKYRPLQYIVVDGLSKDKTLDIIENYNNKFENEGIEFCYTSENDEGISDAFNKGIRQADGDIIGIINSDDKLAGNTLEIVVEKFSEEINVYYGNCGIFKDNCNDAYMAIPSFSRNNSLLRKGMALFHPSTFVSKKTYEKFGLYDNDIKFCMDRDLLLRVYKENGKFLYIDKILAYYREGGTNQTNYSSCANENMQISIKYGMLKCEAKILKMYFKLHDNVWKLIQKLRMEQIFHKKI